MYTLSHYYRDFIDAIGASSEKIYKKLNLPLNAVNDIVINTDKYIMLMNEIDKECDMTLVIQSFNFDKFTEFIPPIYSGLCATNGLECIKRVGIYKKLIGPFTLNISDKKDKLQLTFHFEDSSNIPNLSVVIENIIMTNLLRRGTGLQIIPQEIETTFEYDESLIEFFGIAPVKSDKNSITFEMEDLLEPFVSKNNIMWSYLEPELKKRLQELEKDESISAKVRTILFEKIPAGEGNIETVASQMAVSTRTLQRKLSEENTTFLKQLNHSKELLAKNLMLNTKSSTAEIAYLLGYSEPSAFSRAFLQWTGLTITKFKEQNKGSR
ncbi:MAG: hypothetical protein ATN35_03060 [Epulopiscium sp. Nele67-Bin004]|nr:MAG: hypothetical protein ATN35_03060 [Epulopiscium sp. Nele67-Bin004]